MSESQEESQAVVRIKRKRTEDPVDALRVHHKKRQTGDASVEIVFRRVGEVDVGANFASKLVQKAIGRLDKVPLKSRRQYSTAISNAQRQAGKRRTIRQGTFAAARAYLGDSDDEENGKKDSNKSGLAVFDLSTGPEKKQSDLQITCNDAPLKQKSSDQYMGDMADALPVAASADDSKDYVYDVYAVENNDNGRMDLHEVFSDGGFDWGWEELVAEADPSMLSDDDIDDEDSNAEEIDYPDEDSDAMGGSDDDDSDNDGMFRRRRGSDDSDYGDEYGAEDDDYDVEY
eukprot:m.341999 g.341999  ORF g.341999 m.341999 type:complete len:287 (+) comp20752_c0_seq1:303-1163(+)